MKKQLKRIRKNYKYLEDKFVKLNNKQRAIAGICVSLLGFVFSRLIFGIIFIFSTAYLIIEFIRERRKNDENKF